MTQNDRYSITTQPYDLGRYQLQESVSPLLQPVHSILNKDFNEHKIYS
jgi:hypothetical protein